MHTLETTSNAKFMSSQNNSVSSKKHSREEHKTLQAKQKITCRLVHKMAKGFLTLSHRVRVRREEEREE